MTPAPLSPRPLVSVLMPAYNQAQYIVEALDSLLSQTYTNWEVAVVDDGSPDNVADIVAPYAARDPRIRFFHTENRGVAAARNFAAAHTSGPLLLPLDADDILLPTYIERCVERFALHPETTAAYAMWQYFGHTTKTPPLHYGSFANLFSMNRLHASTMFRRSDFIRIGGYDENLRRGLEDWELWMRLLSPEAVVHKIEEPLFRYRIKERSHNVDAHSADTLHATFTYIYNKHRPLFELYQGNPIDNIMALDHLRHRLDRFRRRSLPSRLWRALRGKI